MKKIQLRIITFAVSLLLLSFSSLCQSQPKATIVSTNTSICESAEINLKIKFEGEAPFGIVFTIFNNETETSKTVTILKQSDAIRSEDIDVNGIWTVSYTISSTSTITLEKVFDATIPIYGTPEGPAWKLEDGSEDVFGEMKITVDRIPDTKAGSNKKGCGLSFPLLATPTNPDSTVFWSDIAAGIFSDPNSPNTVFTAHMADTLDLIFNEISGTCIGRDTVNIEFWGSPKSTISGETTICSTDGNDHTLTLQVMLEGTEPFNFRISNGDDFNEPFTNKPAGITTLYIPVNGDSEYQIIEIKDFNNCQADETDMIGTGIVNDNKPNTFAGDDDVVCDNPKTYKLQGSDNPHENRYWSTNADEISFNDINSDTTQVSASVFGQYTFTWTETYLGCTASDEVEIIFNPNPKLTLLETDVNICEGTEAIMDVSTTASDTNPLTLDYSSNSENATTILNSPTTTLPFSPTDTTEYLLNKLTDKHGCYSDLNDVFTVNVQTVPEANAGMYDPQCTDSLKLDADPSDSNNIGSWESDNRGYFSNPNSPESWFIIPVDDQIYDETFNLYWTEVNVNNPNCLSQDKVQVQLYKEPQKPTIYSGDSIVIYEEDTYQLSASEVENGMTGIWSTVNSDATFDDYNIPDALAKNLSGEDHELVWTISNEGCEESKSDTIFIRSRGLAFPNGFSPNDDDVNDYFNIGGIEKVGEYEFLLFNINGKILYSTNNFGTLGWDGKINGHLLKDGTYYYIFKSDRGVEKNYLIIKSSKRP
ncbi:MAG: gliding motility-associated C-terminal domain-containing protein [Marinilabiliaceae bacterium]|nr:gliding motility-associated C-terminal domain-containing protein [Marinilabiliaceae bacterium]